PARRPDRLSSGLRWCSDAHLVRATSSCWIPVEREVHLQLLDASFDDRDVPGDLAQQNSAFESSHEELRHPRGVRVRAEPAALLASPDRLREMVAVDVEDAGELLAEPLVHVGELGCEIAHRATAHAVALPLRVEHAVEEGVELAHRIGVRIREGRSETALDEGAPDPIDDRVAQVFLALEVVVEVALADPALPQDIVERGGLIALHVDESGGGVENLIAGRSALLAPGLRLDPGLGGYRARTRHRLAPVWALPTSRYRMVAGEARLVKWLKLYLITS